MAGEFQISGHNTAALFNLKLHRGEPTTDSSSANSERFSLESL
jgi:hypothetical protein